MPSAVRRADLEAAAKAASVPLPAESDESYKAVLQAQAYAELIRRKYRKQAEESLFFFARYILDYSDFSESLHKPLCDFIQQAQSQLTLIPRGHFKSTVISVSYPLWLLVKYPDTRILLSNATLSNPEKWVAEQLLHLRSNPVLRWMFPESVPTPDQVDVFGFKSRYTVPNRKAPWGEASIEVTSVDKNVVSRHYEVIIFDDLVSEENSRTKLGLERVEEFYKAAQALLQGEAAESRWRVAPVHTKVVGTRWHYSDLYGSLLERGFPSVVRAALENDQPIFPEMFSAKKLEQLREEMGSAVFASQYMNDPIDPASAIFKREDSRYYEEMPDEPLSIAITVDLAVTEKQYADDSAVVVTGVDSRGRIFVLDYEAGKWKPAKVVDAVYRMYDRWRPLRVYFEANNYQAAFKHIMFEAGKQRGQVLPVVPVRSKGTKYSRILALQPFHEQGHLFLRRSMTELEDQLHRYPKTNHDDIVDALSMRVQRMVWAESTKTPSPDAGDNTWASAARSVDDRYSRNGRVEEQVINPAPSSLGWPE